MESSQLYGGSKKYSSSESGWTSYILSRTQSEDKREDDDHGYVKYKGYDDSDDSLASDASSGPSHLEQAHGENIHFKHEENESTSKYRSVKKAHKQEKKKDELRSKKVGDDDDYKGLSVPSPVQSGTKVRKNNRKSK
ncbi:hypothetical protein ACHQM5_006802 [Ranunculus cassubicifolius]